MRQKKIRMWVWENLPHTRSAQTLEFEPQFERDLTVPSLLRFVIGPRIDELPYILVVNIGIRIIEVRVVEKIRDRGSEGHPDALAHMDVLRHAEVVYVKSRTYQGVESCVPEAPGSYIIFDVQAQRIGIRATRDLEGPDVVINKRSSVWILVINRRVEPSALAALARRQIAIGARDHIREIGIEVVVCHIEPIEKRRHVVARTKVTNGLDAPSTHQSIHNPGSIVHMLPAFAKGKGPDRGDGEQVSP